MGTKINFLQTIRGPQGRASLTACAFSLPLLGSIYQVEKFTKIYKLLVKHKYTLKSTCMRSEVTTALIFILQSSRMQRQVNLLVRTNTTDEYAASIT